MKRLDHGPFPLFVLATTVSAMAFASAAIAADEPQPDSAERQAGTGDVEPGDVESGAARELDFKEVSPETPSRNRSATEYMAVFDLLFRAPKLSNDSRLPIRPVSTRMGSFAPGIGELVNELAP